MAAIPPELSLEKLSVRLLAVEDEMRALEGRVRELEHAGSEFRRALNRLGDALAATHDRPAMLSAVLETCALYVRASSAVFYGVLAGTGLLRPLSSYSTAPPAELADVPVGDGLAGSAGATGAVAVWDAATAHDGDNPAAPSAQEPPARASAVAVPIRSGTHLFGVLALYDRTVDRPFSPEDVDGLATLVRQVEPAIENTFLYEEATRLSITDGLTSLWNRRQFDLRLASEQQRAVRFREPFSVVLLDLDGLKAVNDTLGHQAGDALLVEVAHRLAGGVRDVDVVARFGGDEFGLILPNTGLAGTLLLAEKLRGAIGDFSYDLKDGRPTQVTASIGVACYPEHGSNGRALVGAADEALYRAKALGKNRVESAKVEE